MNETDGITIDPDDPERKREAAKDMLRELEGKIERVTAGEQWDVHDRQVCMYYIHSIRLALDLTGGTKDE